MELYPRDELIDELLDSLKAVSKDQLVRYLCLAAGIDKASSVGYIERQLHRKKIYQEGNYIKNSPKAKFTRRTIIAFEVFLHLMQSNDIGREYFKARYPSEMGFYLEDDIYLITCCEDKYKDANVIALREKENYGCKHIIVGANMEFDEIEKRILPEEDIIYFNAKFNSILNIELEFKQIPKEEIT